MLRTKRLDSSRLGRATKEIAACFADTDKGGRPGVADVGPEVAGSLLSGVLIICCSGLATKGQMLQLEKFFEGNETKVCGNSSQAVLNSRFLTFDDR